MLKALTLAIALLAGNAYATEYKITNGNVAVAKKDVFNVQSPTSRVDFSNSSGESLKIVTTYLGPSATVVPFASGAVVSQYGIKLRNANTCNLVYVMRIFTPSPKISISYKQNIGQTTHEQCGDRGYTGIKSIPMPVVEIGTTIILQAYFLDNTLIVKENNVVVWSGPVNFNSRGSTGFRSDNVKVSFTVE